MKKIPPPPKRGFRLPVNQVVCGDNLDVVSKWPADCVDSIITDPPYGLGFMGKEWDTFKDTKQKANNAGYEITKIKSEIRKSQLKGYASPAAHAGNYDYSRNQEFQQWFTIWAKAMLRICKPGAIMLCFGGTRTFHRLTCAIEDAGWEIRDCMMWLYGSGFPKSHNIEKAMFGRDGKNNLAQLWNGYGTALKPAWEPIIVAMKSKEGSFADNAEKWGVAGLNVDGGRIEGKSWKAHNATGLANNKFFTDGETPVIHKEPHQQGRWPANLILDEEAGKMLDEQSGKISYGKKKGGYKYQGKKYKVDGFVKDCKPQAPSNYADSGGASRFFYCAKTSKKERNIGLGDMPDKLYARSGGAQSAEKQGKSEYLQNHIGLNRVSVVKNNHPTVKPLALMKYLCTLLKMPNSNQIILDPFMGSGTTGMACKELGINYIGIEKEQEYCEIARKRIAAIEPCPN